MNAATKAEIRTQFAYIPLSEPIPVTLPVHLVRECVIVKTEASPLPNVPKPFPRSGTPFLIAKTRRYFDLTWLFTKYMRWLTCRQSSLQFSVWLSWTLAHPTTVRLEWFVFRHLCLWEFYITDVIIARIVHMRSWVKENLWDSVTIFYFKERKKKRRKGKKKQLMVIYSSSQGKANMSSSRINESLFLADREKKFPERVEKWL